jgi:ABC-2 type transport system permease protein
LNWEHLKAVVWLRQRLFRNWLRRSGKANTVVTTIVLSGALLSSVALFFVALLVGFKTLPHASPDQVLYLWNVVIGLFLLFWTIGLMTELQRSEVISFEKLLYFPISLSGTFLVNYVSSFFSISLIAFVPAMIGLCIASVVALGPSLLITFPLLAGLVLMVTAVTYHFRGWLAALMVNKRRRRTLVAFITAGFIVLAQIPNLLGRTYFHSRADRDIAASQKYLAEWQRLNEQLKSRQIDVRRYHERLAALEQDQVTRRNANAEIKTDDLNRWVHTIDLIVPPGWMAYGAMAAARQSVWPGLLGSLGFCLIGGASLRRSYRTTLRFYRGEYRAGKIAKKKVRPQLHDKRVTYLVERHLPWIPEQAAATALATLRSLMRAPEVKMMLLSTLVFGAIFASTLVAGRRSQISESLRPFVAMGIIFTEMLGLWQMFQNQFGFDRDGFRALLLSPSRRQNILLGKNLALSPLALGIGTFALVALQFLYPLSVTHFLASMVQLVSAYLVLCLVGNYTSIVLPTAVRAGSLRASTSTLSGSLLHFLAVLGLTAALAPLFIPLGLDLLLHAFNLGRMIPVYLILAALELTVLVMVYRLLLESQGSLLQAREQKILEAVTTKND